MPRNIKDATLKVTAALPNAANTVNSNVIDLGSATPFPITESIGLRLSTSGGNGANSKNINIRVMHSDEAAANFVNVAELPNPALRVTDNANAGYVNGSANLAFPPTTKRYLKFAALGEANGGDASNGTFTAELLF